MHKNLLYIAGFGISLFLTNFSLLFAQSNIPVALGTHFHLQGSRFQPSRLGESHSFIDFSLPLLGAVHTWAGNHVAKNKQLIRTLDNKISTAEVNEIVNKLKKRNALSLGTYIQYFSLGIKVKKKSYFFAPESEKIDTLPAIKSDSLQIQPDSLQIPEKSEPEILTEKVEFLTFSLDISDRVEGNILLSDALGQLVWNGNKQFAGKTIQLGPAKGNAYWIREFALGVAAPIYEDYLFKIRAGLRLKYLLGLAALQSKRGEAAMTTAIDGSSIDVDVDYLLNTALPADWDNIAFSDLFFKSRGKGFGVDLGASLDYNERFRASLSLLDIGKIKYKREVKNYERKGKIRFEGVEIDDEGNADGGTYLDSLTKEFEPVESSKAFAMSLPTRLSLQVEYKIPYTDRKGREINRHHFFLNYTQGFGNVGIATLKPQFITAYSLNLGTIFNVGASTTFGGYSKIALGYFMSAKLGGFIIGLGTGNLLGLIAQKAAFGAEASLNISFSF